MNISCPICKNVISAHKPNISIDCERCESKISLSKNFYPSVTKKHWSISLDRYLLYAVILFVIIAMVCANIIDTIGSIALSHRILYVSFVVLCANKLIKNYQIGVYKDEEDGSYVTIKDNPVKFFFMNFHWSFFICFMIIYMYLIEFYGEVPYILYTENVPFINLFF